MASLRRHPKSPYWFACFYLPDGTRTQRSTGTSNRSDAMRIALDFEKAAKEAKEGRLTESRARKTISDIFSLANQTELPCSTIKDFFQSWLKRKEIESGERTHERYSGAIKHFLDFMGTKANKDLLHLSSKDIVEMRDYLSRKLSPNSANLTVKVLRTALNQARRDGLLEINEASRVTLIQKKVSSVERRPFTMDELKKLLACADPEWKGMILTGLYTGLRLGDISTLTWNNVDLSRAEINVVTDKTERRQIIPIAKPLLRYFEALPSSDTPGAPVFPEIFEARKRNPHGGGISNQFYALMVQAGLAKPRSHKSTGKGKGAKRTPNELSFHCLRHTATSLLKNAGVSDVVARDLIGHESVAVSANYTHIDDATKRQALNLMPDVTI